MRINIPKALFYILLCSFMFVTNPAKADIVDSLTQELKKAKEDTNKVKLLLAFCEKPESIDRDEFLKFSNEAFVLSNKLNYQKGKIWSLIHLGESYTDYGEYDQALKHFNDALKYCAETKEKGFLPAKVNICIARVYAFKSDYNKSLALYLGNINALDNPNQKREYAKVLHNIAVVYYHNNAFAESRKYGLKSSALFEELKDTVGISTTLNLIGTIYYNEEDYSTALTFYKKAIQLTEKLKDKSWLSTNLNGIGIVYADMKKYAEAIPYFKKVLAIAGETNDQRAAAVCLLNMGICYSGLNNHAEAIKLLNQSLSIAKKTGSKHSTKEAYYFITEACKKQGNYKEALAALENFIIVNDSIYNEENSLQINEFSAKYENEKKEKEIAQLNTDLLSRENKQRQLVAQVEKRNSIITGTIGGAVFLILFLLLLFNRRRLIQSNKHQRDINQQREKTTVAIVQAQENEQVRIAKDLHDGVGTFLSTLKINLQSYEEFIPSNKMDGYKNALTLIDSTSDELRNVMKNLSNETLQEQGLVAAFEELITRMNLSGSTHFDFHTHGLTSRLNAVVESSLYRIGQELITNCLKYSKARHATLQLLADAQSITLTLEDDGVGFDPEDPKLNQGNAGGMGIKNIKDRVNFIKGKLRIESHPKSGTLCLVEIPNT
jgi:two-component system, NarL family, sensor kinase